MLFNSQTAAFLPLLLCPVLNFTHNFTLTFSQSIKSPALLCLLLSFFVLVHNVRVHTTHQLSLSYFSTLLAHLHQTLARVKLCEY